MGFQGVLVRIRGQGGEVLIRNQREGTISVRSRKGGRTRISQRGSRRNRISSYNRGIKGKGRRGRIGGQDRRCWCTI